MGQRPLRTDDLGSRKAEAGDPEDEFPVKEQKKGRRGKKMAPYYVP